VEQVNAAAHPPRCNRVLGKRGRACIPFGADHGTSKNKKTLAIPERSHLVFWLSLLRARPPLWRGLCRRWWRRQ